MATCCTKLWRKATNISIMPSNYRHIHSAGKTDFRLKLDEYLGSETKVKQMRFFFPRMPDEARGHPPGFLFNEKPTLYYFVKVDAPPLSLQDIFLAGCRVLQDYLCGKPLEAPMETAIAALQSFYETKSLHEISLRSLRRPEVARSETSVMSLLAVHFLTQLIPCPDNYFLDKYGRFQTDECPCGCGQPLQLGISTVGNLNLFYGSPDVVLFTSGESVVSPEPDGSKASVFMTKKDHYKMVNESHTAGLEEEDCIIKELNRLDRDDTEKLLRQAMAVSFCYKRDLQSGSTVNNQDSTIIPCCGITSSVCKIAMYDSTNDILLASDDIQLFDDDGSIKFSAMVNLWMVTHHPLFCTGLWKEAIDQFKGSSNIKAYIGDQDLREIVHGSRWFFGLERKPDVIQEPDNWAETLRRPDSIMVNWKSLNHFKQ